MESDSKVYGIRDLHSKVYIFDTRLAIITSANLTTNGLLNNHERGTGITDPLVIQQLLKHFDDLKNIGRPGTLKDFDEWQLQLDQIEIPNTPIPNLPDYGDGTHHYRSLIEISMKRFSALCPTITDSIQLRGLWRFLNGSPS